VTDARKDAVERATIEFLIVYNEYMGF